MMLRLRLLDGREVEDRPLAEQAVALLLLPPRHRLVEHLEHALARARQRAALDECFEDALVGNRPVGALGEVPDRLERPVAARSDDRSGGALADALHGVQAE